MNVLFHYEKKDDAKVREILSQEPFSRGSFNIKDAQSLGSDKPGSFLSFTHDQASVDQLKEALKDIAEPVKDPDEILKKLKQEEDSASAGMGFVFD